MDMRSNVKSNSCFISSTPDKKSYWRTCEHSYPVTSLFKWNCASIINFKSTKLSAHYSIIHHVHCTTPSAFINHNLQSKPSWVIRILPIHSVRKVFSPRRPKTLVVLHCTPIILKLGEKFLRCISIGLIFRIYQCLFFSFENFQVLNVFFIINLFPSKTGLKLEWNDIKYSCTAPALGS